jgi:hypothetical protein
MAQKGDDGPMMMTLEECEQMDKEELALPTPTMEIVKLVEERFTFMTSGGQRRVATSGASTRARTIT